MHGVECVLCWICGCVLIYGCVHSEGSGVHWHLEMVGRAYYEGERICLSRYPSHVWSCHVKVPYAIGICSANLVIACCEAFDKEVSKAECRTLVLHIVMALLESNFYHVRFHSSL